MRNQITHYVPQKNYSTTHTVIFMKYEILIYYFD